MSITGWTSLFIGLVYTRFYEVGLQSGEPYIYFLLKATFSKYTQRRVKCRRLLPEDDARLARALMFGVTSVPTRTIAP